MDWKVFFAGSGETVGIKPCGQWDGGDPSFLLPSGLVFTCVLCHFTQKIMCFSCQEGGLCAGLSGEFAFDPLKATYGLDDRKCQSPSSSPSSKRLPRRSRCDRRRDSIHGVGGAGTGSVARFGSGYDHEYL